MDYPTTANVATANIRSARSLTKSQKAALRRTAIHEAGHVVMLMEHEFPFDHVTIDPTDDYLGVVTHKLSVDLRTTLECGGLLEVSTAAEKLVRVSLAGAIAVGIHYGRRGRWRGAEGDFHNIASYMLAAHGQDGPHLQTHMRHLKFQTEDLLARPGPRWQTKVIAAALLKHRTLSEEEVNKALQEAALKDPLCRPTPLP